MRKQHYAGVRLPQECCYPVHANLRPMQARCALQRSCCWGQGADSSVAGAAGGRRARCAGRRGANTNELKVQGIRRLPQSSVWLMLCGAAARPSRGPSMAHVAQGGAGRRRHGAATQAARLQRRRPPRPPPPRSVSQVRAVRSRWSFGGSLLPMQAGMKGARGRGRGIGAARAKVECDTFAETGLLGGPRPVGRPKKHVCACTPAHHGGGGRGRGRPLLCNGEPCKG